MFSPPCPICRSDSKRSQGSDSQEFSCPRCGKFTITGSALAVLQNKQVSDRQRMNCSSWLWQNADITINSNNLESLLTIATPSFGERADRLLDMLARKSKYAGDAVTVNGPGWGEDGELWCSISWSLHWDELVYLIDAYLGKEKQWIRNTMPLVGSVEVTITPKGYEHLDALRHGRSAEPIGFCAMWFDPSVLPAWTDAISPAIRDAGYRDVRIDGVQHNNRIDDEIMAQIRRSRFVVADFTGQRGGVYFEAGFAIGLGLPVIWTVREDALKDIHFDNRQYNFIQWKRNDLQAYRKALANRIEATLGRGPLAA